MTPTLETQPPEPNFGVRSVGAPAANPQSPRPFLSPSEKDAARAAAADAASGRPEGVRKSDWRRFQRSPQGMMFGIQRQDQQAADAQRERVRLDEQAVAVNRDLFRTNTGIQLDAMNRAARKEEQQDDRLWQTERTKEERAYDEKRRAAQTKEQRAAAASYKPLVVAGRETGYAANELGNLINMGTGDPVELKPEQIAAIRKDGGRVTIGPDGTRVTYGADSDKPSTIKIHDGAGNIRDWPADYEIPATWQEAKPRGQSGAAPVAASDKLKSALERLKK